jgi:hypothetical protein
MDRFFRIATASAASLVAVATLAACSSNSSVPLASQSLQQQSAVSQPAVAQSAVEPRFAPDLQARPRFAALHTYQGPPQLQPAAGLPLWNGSFKYNNNTYNYTMIGANPATSNVTTTIPVDLIPVKVVIDKYTFNPKTKLSNGNTVTQNTLDSPIYQSGIDFVQGGTDLGNTQYIDAFQRGNFWQYVKTNSSYHTLQSVKLIPQLTLKNPSGAGVGNEFGFEAGLVDINVFDSWAESEITSLKVPKNTIPVFLLYDVYLTEGGCCIGGYHNYDGKHVYAQFSYVSKVGAFSQDVSALSHETGEYYDDPLTNNQVACGILEVGDPLEGGPNFGGYPYTLNGFKYNLQDLVFLPYFGAPPTTSVNSWFTFQNEKLSVCQNGG